MSCLTWSYFSSMAEAKRPPPGVQLARHWRAENSGQTLFPVGRATRSQTSPRKFRLANKIRWCSTCEESYASSQLRRRARPPRDASRGFALPAPVSLGHALHLVLDAQRPLTVTAKPPYVTRPNPNASTGLLRRHWRGALERCHPACPEQTRREVRRSGPRDLRVSAFPCPGGLIPPARRVGGAIPACVREVRAFPQQADWPRGASAR